jgi:hypothetical protein
MLSYKYIVGQLTQLPNGWHYWLVVGRRLHLLYGKKLRFETSFFSVENPTCRVHAVLGSGCLLMLLGFSGKPDHMRTTILQFLPIEITINMLNFKSYSFE